MQDRRSATSPALNFGQNPSSLEANLDDCLSAAEGYLDLGMPVDSWNELESVPSRHKGEEAVLALRIRIFEHCQRWDFARQFAEALTKHFPANPRWWLAWSRNLRREVSVKSAREILEEALDLHPSNPQIRYQLACLTCAMGEVAQSAKMLQSAFSLDSELVAKAQSEPDLKRLGVMGGPGGIVKSADSPIRG